MPGASTITLHVDGDAIKAKVGGPELDAAGNGTPGSNLTGTFTTVSTAPSSKHYDYRKSRRPRPR